MPAGNLARLLLDGALARGRAQSLAIREPRRAWSYGKLNEEVGRVASALHGLGLRGERVAILLHDSAEWVTTFLGAVRAGVVPVPVSTLLRALDVRALLGDARAAAVVASADLAPIVEEVRGDLPALRIVLALGGAQPGQVDFHALTREAPVEGPTVEPSGDETAFVMYATGAERHGIVHTHGGALAAERALADLLVLTPEDRVFSAARLTSSLGLTMGLLCPLAAGATTCLLPARAKPHAVFELLADAHPTVFAAAPSLYGQLLADYRKLPSPRPAYFDSVRLAVAGGEPLPPTLEQRFAANFGRELVQGFGTTETLGFVLANRPNERRPASVGKPLPGVEVRVVGEGGAPVAPAEIGALEIRTGATKSDWLRTGDRFLVDTDGFYFFCGRSDERFKVSGRWVAPDEIERTLLSHPAVWECAVVEGADEDGLAHPIAYIVPNVGVEPSDVIAAQLMEFVKREIAPYKYPRAVFFVESLPKSAGGKILRWKLRRSDKGAWTG